MDNGWYNMSGLIGCLKKSSKSYWISMIKMYNLNMIPEYHHSKIITEILKVKHLTIWFERVFVCQSSNKIIK